MLRPRHAYRARRRARPMLEGLEDRRLLSMINVNTIQDPATVSPGVISLREALASAQAGDIINFDANVFATPRTITLDPSQGQLVIGTNVTIQGPAVGVTLARSTAAGTPSFRILEVNSGVTDATLENLTMTTTAR
jgi:hypothetical protein